MLEKSWATSINTVTIFKIINVLRLVQTKVKVILKVLKKKA